MALIFGLNFSSSSTSYASEIDKSDNKAPILVSIKIEKSNLVFNEMTTIKLIIRDDKNDIGGSIYLQFQAPSDAPGNLKPYVSFGILGKNYSNVTKENNYIEYTYLIPVKAPEWPGTFSPFQIFMLEDLNGNKSAFYLNQKCRNVNDAAGSQALAFPEVIPECNVNFAVRDLTPAEKIAMAEKVAQQAAADKAAADKAAAEKAAADKAAAESKSVADSRKATIDNLNAKLMALLIAKPDLKLVILKAQNSLNSIKFSSSANEDFAFKQQLLPIEKQIQVLEKMQTITCTKGKVTKKVTAVKPKCPVGYRKR
jgi:hypothetical protein